MGLENNTWTTPNRACTGADARGVPKRARCGEAADPERFDEDGDAAAVVRREREEHEDGRILPTRNGQWSTRVEIGI